MAKRVSIIFVWVLMAFAVVAVAALLTSQRANTAACQEANDVRSVLTNLLTRAEAVSASNEEFTQAEKEAASKFYRRSLEELATHHC